jgi:hypothetical protein
VEVAWKVGAGFRKEGSIVEEGDRNGEIKESKKPGLVFLGGLGILIEERCSG